MKRILTRCAAVFALTAWSVQAAPAANSWLSLKGQQGIGRGQQIVFITGEEYYRSEEGMSMFAKILSQRYGYDCTVLFATDKATGTINPNISTHIPGLQALNGADLMVIFARFRELPDADMKHIVDYVNAGKPVMGIRNATHAFRYVNNKQSPYVDWTFNSRNWRGGFGQQILGDTWVSHYGKYLHEATLAHANAKHRSHPVMQGVPDKVFCRTDVNGVNKLTADDVVLLHGQVLSGPKRDDPPVTDNRKDTRMPLAWFKTYTAPSGKTGRSFCTTAGSSTDWLEEGLRRLLINAIFSLTDHDKQIPAETNVDYVGTYSPTAYGHRSNNEWNKLQLQPASFGL